MWNNFGEESAVPERWRNCSRFVVLHIRINRGFRGAYCHHHPDERQQVPLNGRLISTLRNIPEGSQFRDENILRVSLFSGYKTWKLFTIPMHEAVCMQGWFPQYYRALKWSTRGSNRTVFSDLLKRS
jgi:hypothetical protein